MNLRTHTAQQYRQIRRILRGTEPEPDQDDLREDPNKIYSAFIVIGSILLALMLIISLACTAHADTINPERLANAIYKAENSKAHPYGILVHYKNTTPRKACLNTIRHRLEQWNGQGDFISYLAQTYAPRHVFNDPKDLNRNWIKNVRYFYNIQGGGE